MFTRFFSAIFGLGIGLAVAIAPAHAADDIEADQLIAEDRVLTRGTLAYFKAKRAKNA